MSMPSSVTVAAGAGTLVVLVGTSAFFSTSETAIFSLPTEWIDAQSGTDDRRGVALADLYDDPHRLLVTILVGNNLVNIALSSLVTLVVADFLSGGAAVAVATLVAATIVLVFGEVVPKSYGLANPERVALAVARPLAAAEVVLGPPVAAFDAVAGALTAVIGGTPAIERQYER